MGVSTVKLTLYDYCAAQGKEAILGEWDREKNRGEIPADLSRGSHQKAWWTCERGHSWEAAVYTRTSGSGCPYCAGRQAWPGENDLASRYPDLAEQWHSTKNAPLTAEQVTIGSHHKVWWQCEKGHEWQAAVKTRVGGTGCPYCANRAVIPGENDLAATHPELVQEGILKRIHSVQRRSLPAPLGKCGGSVRKATSGRLRWPPGQEIGRASCRERV